MQEEQLFTVPLDERTAEQIADARAAADRQAGWIREYWPDRDRRSALAETLMGNRNTRADDPERARDYDRIATIGRDGEPIFVVEDEHLVRTVGSVAETVAALERLGWDAEPIAELDHRVVRAFHAAREEREQTPMGFLKSACGRVTSLVRSLRLRRAAIELRRHFIAPMGIVMKADCDPDPAAQRCKYPGSPGAQQPVHVAVIDTGIADQPRTWLTNVPVDAGNEDILDDIPADKLLDVGAGHGTFAAGVVQQMAPGAAITVYRALETDGLGSEKAAAIAMVRAADAGAQILNLSFGVETDDDRPPVAIEVAVELIRERHPDVLLVAAAGNFGRDRPCWPGALKHVVAVGALTRKLEPADWSSHGSWVDCSTIGEGVLSVFVAGTEPDGQKYEEDSWGVWTGTSFAAPQVAGAVAQIVQRDGIGPREAFARLVAGRPARPGFGSVVEILPPT